MKKTTKKDKINYMSEPLMYLFNEGKHYNLYKMLGAHKEKNGYRFAVWAPEATAVSVVCDFNGWDKDKNPMEKHENHGIWETFIKGIGEGETYKYLITTRNGEELYKADPMAFASQLRPETASVTADLSYEWSDEAWLTKREKTRQTRKTRLKKRQKSTVKRYRRYFQRDLTTATSLKKNYLQSFYPDLQKRTEQKHKESYWKNSRSLQPICADFRKIEKIFTQMKKNLPQSVTG